MTIFTRVKRDFASLVGQFMAKWLLLQPKVFFDPRKVLWMVARIEEKS
jgi:hypothetical protein